MDDETSILNNPSIRNLGDLKAIFYYSPSRFLTYFTFALNYAFGGFSVTGYHVLNIALHIASALMVWLLCRQILGSPELQKNPSPGASALLPLAAALIFVAHPIQTQAVTYIVQRAASMATLFIVLSLFLYGEGRLQQLRAGANEHSLWYFAGSSLAGLAGIFSKETALILPGAVVLYESFFFKGLLSSTWRYMAGLLALVVLIPMAFVAQDLISFKVGGALPAASYLLTQPKVWLTYLRLFVFPAGQNLDHNITISHTPDFSTLASLSLIAVMAFAGFKLFRKKRVLSFGIFWFLLSLVPESGLIPLPDVMFEHRMYLPMVGLSMLAAALLFEMFGRRSMQIFAGALTLTIGVLGLITFERNKVWADDLTLWSDVTRKSPQKARGFLNLARVYADRGRHKEAIDALNRVMLIDPANADAYGNHANIMVQQGRPDQAIADCNRALALGGGLPYQLARIYFNRGTAYLLKNRVDSALSDFNAALRYDPQHETLLYNRALVYSRLGETQKAIDDYSQSLILNPGNAKVLNNRGVLLRENGELGKALADFDAAIRAESGFAQSYLNRGLVLGLQGKVDSAIDDFTAFVSMLPKNPDGYYNRALMKIRRQDPEGALSDLQKTLELNPLFGPAYVDRARAFIALGQYAAAGSDLQRAKALGAAVEPSLVELARKGKK